MKSPLKTLIIEDEWLIRTELKSLLSSFDSIEVIAEASNAVEATKLVSAIKPDLIFLDIQLPGITGFDFLDKVNANFDVIFISGYEDKIHQAKKYHAVDYLMKPIDKKRLAKAVDRAVNNQINSKSSLTKLRD
jgi:two-component system LytT family response regulator